MNYKEKLAHIKAFAFDVDGVFTDNTLYILEDVQPMRKMNVKDGYALQYLVKLGYPVSIISGGKSEGVRQRFQGLGLKDIYLGAHDKIVVFDRWIAEHDLKAEEVLYIGDDIPDIPVHEKVGLSVAPQDAAVDVKLMVDHVSPFKGGEGCVRDMIEQFLRLKEEWLGPESRKW